MVKYLHDGLSQTFSALADPTRRAILVRLASHSELSVSELARPFPIKLPAVLKHVDVLCDSGLVIRNKIGRTVHCRLAPQGLLRAERWLERTSSFWKGRLDNLDDILEARRGKR